MSRIIPVDAARCSFDIHRDLSVSPRERRPGPPRRIDGVTVGIVTMSEDAPHGGEVHPDGDEILYVLSGRVRVTGDSEPGSPLELGPGEACIVKQGEWHRVHILEPGPAAARDPRSARRPPTAVIAPARRAAHAGVRAQGTTGKLRACQVSMPPASGRTCAIPRRFSRSATRALDTSLGQEQYSTMSRSWGIS